MLIIEYNAVWIIHFEKIKEKLLATLLDLSVNIEHVGSTAVPLLAAKPIIDIDIIYHESSDFERIKNNLEAIGYFHNGNQGVDGREVFKRNGNEKDEILDKIVHHLYVCKYDSAELHRHILFRDYLRRHDIARDFYQNLKYEIVKEAKGDRKKYASIKEIKATSFINFIIELSKTEHNQSQPLNL